MKEASWNDIVDVTLKSVETGVVTAREMYNPFQNGDRNVKDAFVLRHQTTPGLWKRQKEQNHEKREKRQE